MKSKKLFACTVIAATSFSTIACANQAETSSAKKTSSSVRINKKVQNHYQIYTKTWHIKNGRETIYGHIHMPKNYKGKMKVAILSHGLGGNYE